jgi:hypothetical protein
MAKVRQLPLFTTEGRLIDILDRELQRAHANEDFYRGKVERLELSMATFGNQPAKAYVDRTDVKPITEVPVPAETGKKPWKQVQQEWAAMTEEQREAAIAKAPD